MHSTSKSCPQNSKCLSKSKPISRVKQPTRNWLELPSDLMVNILQRVGVIDILENAQKVCTAWRAICKDPAIWKVIHMKNNLGSIGIADYQKKCKHAVDRSQGQLVELTVVGFCDYELLHFVADRASQLRRLEIIHFIGGLYGICCEVLKKLSLLEELSLFRMNISVEHIMAAAHYCPLLKTLKVNQSEAFKTDDGDGHGHDDDEGSMNVENEIAKAIGKNLPELTHLELIGNSMENVGLQAILDGCTHLESLDLRRCSRVDLEGELGKRCLRQIKHVKLPHESLADHAYGDAFDEPDDDLHEYDDDPEYHGYMDSEGEYHEYLDDEYDQANNNADVADFDNYAEMMADFYNLREMMAFISMMG